MYFTFENLMLEWRGNRSLWVRAPLEILGIDVLDLCCVFFQTSVTARARAQIFVHFAGKTTFVKRYTCRDFALLFWPHSIMSLWLYGNWILIGLEQQPGVVALFICWILS